MRVLIDPNSVSFAYQEIFDFRVTLIIMDYNYENLS